MGYAGVLASLTAVMIFSWLALRYRRFGRQLLVAHDRRRLLSQLAECRPEGAYAFDLERLLDKLRRHAGSPLSANALGICVGTALLYVFASLFVAWGLGAEASFGQLVLLPELPMVERQLWAAGTLTALVLILMLAVWGERLDLMTVELLTPEPSAAGARTAPRFGMLRLVLCTVLPAAILAAAAASGPLGLADYAIAAAFSVLAIVVAGAGAMAVLAAVAIVTVVGVSGAGSHANALAAAAVGVTAAALAAAIARVGASVASRVVLSIRTVGVAGLGAGIAIAVRQLLSEPSDRAASWLAFCLLYLVLPVAIASCDWLSWALHRWLAPRFLAFWSRAAVGPARLMTVTARVVLDLLLALAFCFLLAASLPLLLRQYDLMVSAVGLDPSSWMTEAFLCSAVREPATDGLWLLLLLLSAALPSLTHSVILLASPVCAWLSNRPGLPELVAASRFGTIRGPDRQRLALMMAIRRPVGVSIGLTLTCASAAFAWLGIEWLLGVRLGPAILGLAIGGRGAQVCDGATSG